LKDIFLGGGGLTLYLQIIQGAKMSLLLMA